MEIINIKKTVTRLLWLLIIGFVPVFQNCGEGEESLDYDCVGDIDLNNFPFEGYNSTNGFSYDTLVGIDGMVELLLEKNNTFQLKLSFNCDSPATVICNVDNDFEQTEINIVGTWEYEQMLDRDIVTVGGNCGGFLANPDDCETVWANKLSGFCYLKVTNSSIPLSKDEIKCDYSIQCSIKSRSQSLGIVLPIYKDHVLHFGFMNEESYDLLNSDY